MLIGAMERLMQSALSRSEESIYYNHLPDGLVIPRFEGENSGGTCTWPDALRRFGTASDAVIESSADWALWARVLVLGMMAMTFGARDLMFSDDIELLLLRGARSPPLAVRRTFIAQLIEQHNAFARDKYRDAARFVCTCASIFYMGTPHLADQFRFVLQQ